MRERKRIIFEDGHIAYISSYPFYNKRYIEWLNRNSIVNVIDSRYLYFNEFNSALPIKKDITGVYRCSIEKEMHPVSGINWFGAKAVCNYFNGRLPYKTEMEFLTKESMGGKAINCGELIGDTNIVYKYDADKWGLYDICGNVAEWCEDINAYDEEERCVFGVSWNNNYNDDYIHFRYKWAYLGAVSIGFRVVWDE